MSNSTGRALEPEQVLDVLEARDRDERPVMTSNEIADVLINERGIDVTPRTVKNRLDELERADEVATHTPGRTAIYWLPGERMIDSETAAPGASEQDHSGDPADKEPLTGGGVDTSLEINRGEFKRDIQNTVDEAVNEAFRKAERQRTREKSDDTIETWGDRAIYEAKVLARLGVLSGCGFAFFALILGIADYTGAGTASPPLLSVTFSEVVLLLAMIMLAGFIIAPGAAILLGVIGQSGVADWAERKIGTRIRDVSVEN